MMRLLNDSPVRLKVLLVPMILLIAFICVSFLANFGLNQQRAILREVNDIALEKITLVNQFAVLSEQVQSDVYRISVLRSMNLSLAEIQPIQADLSQGISDVDVLYGEMLLRWPLDATEKDILARMGPPLETFSRQAQQAAIVVVDNPSFGVLLVRSSSVPFIEFRQILTEFLDYQQAQILDLSRESSQRASTIATTILMLTLVIAGIATLGTMHLSKHLISSPIRTITGLMHRLAQGDLAIQVTGLQRRDEIGEMAQALEVFHQNALEKARLDKELRESEVRYRQLVDLAPIGIAVHQHEELVFVNAAIIQLMGATSAQDLIGKSVFDFIHPDSLEVVLQRSSVLLAGGSGPLIEEKFIRLDGQSIDVEVITTPISYAGQLAVQVLVTDITKRKEAEQRTFEMALEREQMIFLTKFIDEVSHEFRTPLSLMQTNLYFLARIDDPAKRQIKLTQMGEQITGISRLVDLLAEVTRLESSGPFAMQSLDLNKRIGLLLDEMPALAAGDLTLHRGLAPDLPVVMAEEYWLSRALHELLGNAIRFTPPGGDISVRTVADGEGVKVMVQDTGSGIPPDVLPHIFERFYRQDVAHTTPGFGLGLPLAQAIIERHGGRIWVESTSDEGSTFCLTLKTVNS